MPRRRISKEEFDANNARDAAIMRGQLTRAADAFESAAERLRAVLSRSSYTTGELREIRTLVLRAVRHDLDPTALVVMPDERHY